MRSLAVVFQLIVPPELHRKFCPCFFRLDHSDHVVGSKQNLRLLAGRVFSELRKKRLIFSSLYVIFFDFFSNFFSSELIVCCSPFLRLTSFAHFGFLLSPEELFFKFHCQTFFFVRKRSCDLAKTKWCNCSIWTSFATFINSHILASAHKEMLYSLDQFSSLHHFYGNHGGKVITLLFPRNKLFVSIDVSALPGQTKKVSIFLQLSSNYIKSPTRVAQKCANLKTFQGHEIVQRHWKQWRNSEAAKKWKMKLGIYELSWKSSSQLSIKFIIQKHCKFALSSIVVGTCLTKDQAWSNYRIIIISNFGYGNSGVNTLEINWGTGRVKSRFSCNHFHRYCRAKYKTFRKSFCFWSICNQYFFFSENVTTHNYFSYV